jgi:hypothetical protein
MMKKEIILQKTISKLTQLSGAELKEAHDFIDFLTFRLEERDLAATIQKQAQEGQTFQFLEDEEELYNEQDLQKTYPQ